MSHETKEPANATETGTATATAKGTADDPIILKQMTQKSLGIDPKSVRKMAPGSSIKLGVFFGMIQGIKMKESNFSDELNAMFIGEFRAVHPVNGYVYNAEKAYFFKALSDKLQATFETGGQKPVEFAYEISSVEVEKAQLGYEYVAASLIPTAASDRMTVIAAQVAEKMSQRAIAAPATEAEATKPEATKPETTDKKKK